MNTLFLLATGIAMLLMSQRFLRRVLDAAVFRPLAGDTPPPTPVNGAPSSGSGGILPLFGIALGLTWGWAPMFVWLLLGAGLLSRFATGALAWLTALTPGRGGLMSIGVAGGAALERAMRLTLCASLLVLGPLLATTAAAMVANQPDVLGALLLQALIAIVAVIRPPRNQAGIAAVAIVGALAIPAGIAAGRSLDLAVPPGSDFATAVVAATVLVVTFAMSRRGDQRAAESVGRVVLPGAALVAGMLVLALLVTRPDVALLAYHQPVDFPGPLPLVAASAIFAIMPSLSILLGSGGGGNTPRFLDGSAVEGMVALLLLAVLLAAPTLTPALVADLPGWTTGIDPGRAAISLVAAFDALAVGLPMDGAMFASAAVTTLVGLSVASLVSVVGVLRAEAGRSVRPADSAGMLVDALLFAGLILVAFAILWRGALAPGLWVTAGALSLLFGAGLQLTAALAAIRIKRPAAVLLLPGIALALAFWWVTVSGVISNASAGDYALLAANLAASLVGGVATTALAVNFAKIRKFRRAGTALR